MDDFADMCIKGDGSTISGVRDRIVSKLISCLHIRICTHVLQIRIQVP